MSVLRAQHAWNERITKIHRPFNVTVACDHRYMYEYIYDDQAPNLCVIRKRLLLFVISAERIRRHVRRACRRQRRWLLVTEAGTDVAVTQRTVTHATTAEGTVEVVQVAENELWSATVAVLHPQAAVRVNRLGRITELRCVGAIF